ncbi:alpha-hydroxy acid oxidase [Methylopila henanensis]|uniref:Alpha-hydroxy acid oxidase n=1 Tax=Methylopila henanensis TaxID=873516 RepID=A0ABW4K4B9_9HYPH
MSAGPAVPPDVASLADYERHAKALLPPDVWAYVAGAGADGLTQRWNREAFDARALAGRALVDMAGATTAATLFGAEMPFPIMLAPVARQTLAHPDGERATALGAGALGAWMTLSVLSSAAVEEVAAAARAPLWLQLYMQGDRDWTLGLLRRAEACGCRAIVLTVDAAVSGVRNDEQRAGFRAERIDAVHLHGAPMARSSAGPGESPVFKGLLDGAPTWADVDWLRAQTALPLLLKGVVHPDDAERALDRGVDGIVVSNHGGRTLDTLPASLHALERMAERVGGRAPLLLDGGVRRGTDVLKALACGASAVMVGQPQIHALAVAGAVGVAHMLAILRAEFEVAMALTGRRAVSEITRDTLW